VQRGRALCNIPDPIPGHLAAKWALLRLGSVVNGFVSICRLAEPKVSGLFYGSLVLEWPGQFCQLGSAVT